MPADIPGSSEHFPDDHDENVDAAGDASAPVQPGAEAPELDEAGVYDEAVAASRRAVEDTEGPGAGGPADEQAAADDEVADQDPDQDEDAGDDEEDDAAQQRDRQLPEGVRPLTEQERLNLERGLPPDHTGPYTVSDTDAKREEIERARQSYGATADSGETEPGQLADGGTGEPGSEDADPEAVHGNTQTSGDHDETSGAEDDTPDDGHGSAGDETAPAEDEGTAGGEAGGSVEDPAAGQENGGDESGGAADAESGEAAEEAEGAGGAEDTDSDKGETADDDPDDPPEELTPQQETARAANRAAEPDVDDSSEDEVTVTLPYGHIEAEVEGDTVHIGDLRVPDVAQRDQAATRMLTALGEWAVAHGKHTITGDVVSAAALGPRVKVFGTDSMSFYRYVPGTVSDMEPLDMTYDDAVAYLEHMATLPEDERPEDSTIGVRTDLDRWRSGRGS